MAAHASEGPQWWRRWPRDDDEPRAMEEEEGEVVPGGSHSNSETDTDEYYNRHSPSEYYDDEADSGRRGATTVVVPANNGGHARASSVTPRGWGGTGKRGRSGARAVSSSAEPDHQSMATAAAAAPKAVLKPVVPLAFAPASSVPTASAARTTNLSGESSIGQSVRNDDAMETVVEMAGAATAILPVEAAAAHQQPVAPPPPPPRPRPASAAAGRQNPDGYTCPKCGMWFATHQGLGGHSVGHKHKEREELLAAAPGGGRDDVGKRRRVHVCGECGAEYATGVQLGGHMRKHWTGAPIVPKKKKPRAAAAAAVLDHPLPPPAGAVRATDVTLALAVKADDDTSLAAATPPTVEPEIAVEPAARSPLMGRLRLFGVDIGPAVKTPEAQQGSPATGSSRSTGGPQNSHSE